MGIKGAFKLLAKATNVSKTGPQKKVVVIDGSFLVYNTFLATKTLRTMTAPDGKTPTGHIKIIYNKVKKFHKDGCRLIVVWDAGTTALKEELKKERQDQKEQAKEKYEKAKTADGVSEATLARLEKLGVSPGLAFGSARQLFKLLGVPQITSPEKYEAEHVCAQICMNGIGDVVYTKDSDALFFGATEMGWHAGGKYHSIALADALKLLDVDFPEFQRIGIMLGCDFAPKSTGIGPATVLKSESRQTVKFTERQEQALAMFREKIDVAPGFTRDTLKNDADHDAVKQFLASLGFKKT